MCRIEEASFEIVKFLEIDCTEENSNGWMLLTTVNLLASADKTLVEVMTEASLPSTLVKCLYLFFDLPDLEDPAADIVEGESDFTPRERRILLQKIFVQVLCINIFVVYFSNVECRICPSVCLILNCRFWFVCAVILRLPRSWPVPMT